MADLPPYPDAHGDPGGDPRVRPARGSTTSTPRWVKMFVIIFIVLVLLFVIMHLTGNGFAGHQGLTPPASAIARVLEHGVPHR